MSDDDKKDYKVGYKKPPKHTRFGAKNANQGNKKGRPKVRREIERISEEALWSTVTESANAPIDVTERGETITVPLLEAIIKGMGRDAAGGDRFARRDYMKYLEKASQYNDKLHLDMHMVLADLREQRLKFINEQGSFEHINFLYGSFLSKKHLRTIEGDDKWPYEDGEPITDENWAIFIVCHELLQKDPERRIEWPIDYSGEGSWDEWPFRSTSR